MSKAWYAQSVDGIEVFSTPADAQSHAEQLLAEDCKTAEIDGLWPMGTATIEWGELIVRERAMAFSYRDYEGDMADNFKLVAADSCVLCLELPDACYCKYDAEPADPGAANE